MATRQERIIALLQIKDAARFKGTLKSAARSVREFGEDTTATARKLELLESIDERLGHQTLALAAVLKIANRQIKHTGNEAVEAAVKLTVFDRALDNAKDSMTGLNFPFRRQLTSFKFWKDRLSLTRSEIVNTALTIGAYLLPALIAIGSSATAAAIGGGLVVGGGIAALTIGLLGLGLVATSVVGQIGKVKSAQDAYNLAVAQYGQGSKQAAAASARMYGVIQTQGGRPTWEAVKAIQALKDEWKGATGGSRRNFMFMITDGIKNARRLLPTFARETNLNMISMRSAFGEAGKMLSGSDMKKTITSLSGTFRSAIGPGARGTANLIMVIGRWLRAAGPWAVKWAHAWERTTMAWRRGSSDGKKLHNRMTALMDAAGAWWGLLKSLGRTLKLVFKGSNKEGTELVKLLTKQVDRFNEWLKGLEKSGKLRAAFRWYIDSIKNFIWALQNPVAAVNKWLPPLIDAMGAVMVEAGPRLAGLMWTTFWSLEGSGKFLAVSYLLYKFGVFKSVARMIGRGFGRLFMEKALPWIAATLWGPTGVTSTGSFDKVRVSGQRLGRVFGRGLMLGAILGIAALSVDVLKAAKDKLKEAGLWKPPGGEGSFWDKLIPDTLLPEDWQHPKGPIAKWLGIAPKEKQSGGLIPGIGSGDKVPLLGEPGEFVMRRAAVNAYGSSFFGMLNRGMLPIQRLAAGGMVLPGMLAAAGDGPQISIASPKGGTIISPFGGGAGAAPVANLQSPAIDVGGLQAPIHVHVEIDKREIARAYIDHKETRRSRRGER